MPGGGGGLRRSPALLVLLCAARAIAAAARRSRVSSAAPAPPIIVPLGMAYVGDVVPYERRQPVLARFLAGQMCGMIAGQIAGGVIGDHFGWRTVFIVLAFVFAVAGARAGEPVPRQSRGPGRCGGRPSTCAGPDRGLPQAARRAAGRASSCSPCSSKALIFFGGFTYVAADLQPALRPQLLRRRAGGRGLRRRQRCSTRSACAGWCAARRARSRDRRRHRGDARLSDARRHAAVAERRRSPSRLLGFGYYMLHNTLQTNATQMLPEARGTAVAGFSSALFLGRARASRSPRRSSTAPARVPVFVLAAVLWPILALWVRGGSRRRQAARPPRDALDLVAHDALDQARQIVVEPGLEHRPQHFLAPGPRACARCCRARSAPAS